MKKAIITVVGKDTVGIIAKVCVFLAENNVNILDISQTIVDGYFNMMMIVDVTGAEFDKVATGLKEVGESIGVIIRCQREDIFDKMHRI
jgi:ACT domain-containing protein